MSERDRIKKVLKEAEIYRTQGLLIQSREKYRNVIDQIKKSPALSKDKALIKFVGGKIREVQSDIDAIENAQDTPELSEKVQNLISSLFSFSKGKEMAAIEGAVALAKFGQYEKALAKFQKLLNEGILPLMVAKNMLKCHLSLASTDAAISQFERWVSHNAFSKRELNYLRHFLERILINEGIKYDLPEGYDPSHKKSKKEERAEDIFEISSVRVVFNGGPFSGQIRDFDVTFQMANVLSFNIKAGEKDMWGFLKPGIRFSKIQCYSPVSLFNAQGRISENRMVMSGPRRGDYLIDLIVEGA
ncbi:MAG: hypothetical protein JRJ85_10705 [Deltaproteobacteria bacterium]|nr:hypothetical protein [Deltaproteobacteria bacterium]